MLAEVGVDELNGCCFPVSGGDVDEKRVAAVRCISVDVGGGRGKGRVSVGCLQRSTR